MYLYDLPEVIQSNIFALVDDTRSRNAMALVCQRWRQLERTTRASITLRGNVRHLFLLPTCFPSITNLDISLLSPWGYSLLHHHNVQHQNQHDPFHLPDQVVAGCLRRAFPLVTSLTVYARTPSVLEALVPQWPDLRHVKLVRWHQRPSYLPGSDFAPLLHGCPMLTSLDLSNFYCWTDDLPAALQARPPLRSITATNNLTRLDLLSLSSVEGFKSYEILAISSACPTLRHLLVPCVFDTRYHDFVGDETLQVLASNCKNLATLHLIDHSALSAPRRNPDDEDGESTSEDAKVTPLGLENMFVGLPMLEDLVLDVCHRVRDVGPALEGLNQRCRRIRSLKLGQFLGVCRAAALHLDGVAVCGGLTSLSLKNSADLTDASLVTIARGCTRLLKFEIQGCKMVTEVGLRKLTSMLRSTLVEVGIFCCKNLDALRSTRALEPIRDRIQRLSIDLILSLDEPEHHHESANGKDRNNFVPTDPDEEYDEYDEEEDRGSCYYMEKENGDYSRSKKCKLSSDLPVHVFNKLLVVDDSGDFFWYRTWKRLKYLSLWLPVGELLTPLSDIGFESCPELEEMCIKVEGDCRTCPVPSNQAFGLISLVQYPKLSKMKLDCGDAIGFLLTAPKGQMDLSLWERFYLNGVKELQLEELDYWPPQDKDMNQRSVSLPAVGLLAECRTLRKLFIHGTAHEHFMGFLLNIPNLRDVQLREDYYPAPENDTSTEMRVDSCSRFEEALNRRLIPD